MKRLVRSGFSLLEILIAMVLLAGVGAATMTAFTSSIQVTSSDASVAYNFGRGLLEQFYERVRQDQWTTAALPLSTVNPGPQGQTKTLNGDTYTANYTVTAIDQDGANGEDYRRVTMTVAW